MTVRISIKNVPKTIAFLQLKEKNVNGKIEKSMTKVGTQMQNEVKLSIAGHKAEPTSVDTGRFLNSVYFNISSEGVIIFSDVPYAKFLEFGRRGLQPRRHFNNSLDRNKHKINEIIRGNLRNI